MHPFAYQGEDCPDFGECWDRLFGKGNDYNNLQSTEGGKKLFREMLEGIYDAISDSIYDVVWYRDHPLISIADTNGTFVEGTDEWADFKDQMLDNGQGLMTLIDYQQTIGRDNFNVEIKDADIDGAKYIGDVKDDLIERVKEKESRELRLANTKAVKTRSGIQFTGLRLLSRGIFNALRRHILADYGGSMEAYNIEISGSDGNGWISQKVINLDGVLHYCMDEWDSFGAITGTHTHRIISTTPGILGIAYDVPVLNDRFPSLGLRIVQKLDAPDNGRAYMDTNFDLGTALLSLDHMTQGSKTVNLEAAANID